MKKMLLTATLFVTSFMSFAQVGIGTTTPEGILDVVSTDSGVIVPRVDKVDEVTTPVKGMIVYDVEEECFKGYIEGSTKDVWASLTPCTPLEATYTIADPTYQGESVIDATGIGYNGEAVPAASTITVQANVTSIGAYTVSATDAATGLEYSATDTFTTTGTQPIVLKNNNAEMPKLESGFITMTTTGNYTGANVELKPRIDIKSIPASDTAKEPVVYGTQTWMNRNLGARRVATAIDDVFSYGNYYQWGRNSDGHEIVVINGDTKTEGRGLADTTNVLAEEDDPKHPNFIIVQENTGIFDWRSDNNNNRWATISQGPCPDTYHVPTKTEWDIADTFGSWNNNTDAYNSALKLPSSGFLYRIHGLLDSQGIHGYYWSSTVNGELAYELTLNSAVAFNINGSGRANAYTVRCILTPPPKKVYTISTPTYQGKSVIGTTGIGYNGEAVPAASTITVQADVTDISGGGAYTVSATDAATGLEYSATGTFTATGTQPIVLKNNNAKIPEFTSGVIAMTTTGNYTGADVTLKPRIDIKSIPASKTDSVDVVYGTQTWMDRNLGARRAATAIDDAFSYGNYYQWGRPADGHEIVVIKGDTKDTGRSFNGTTTTLAATDIPGHSDFITIDSYPNDWRDDNNNNRWATANQGPCPDGYHVPTHDECIVADTFGTWNNNTDTYSSALKLPSPGYSSRGNGFIYSRTTHGYYWKSTAKGVLAYALKFNSTEALNVSGYERAFGFSVRCIKNATKGSPTNGTGVVSAYTCSSSTASAGAMTAGTAVSGVTQTIRATVTTAGSYIISATANGVTFAGSGTFAGTGDQDIVLTATGKPIATGSTSFTLNTTPDCSFNRTTTVAAAIFTLPQSVAIVSILDGTPLIDIQGTINNTTKKFIVNVPYTNGSGPYTAYTSASAVANAAGTGQGGDTNSFTISYPAGTLSASGAIPVTIVVDGDGTFNATKQLFGELVNIATIPFQLNGVLFGNIKLDVVGGVPDRNFADANHKFIYIPITAADGKTWLNNNLGANYSNLNHAAFNPMLQAQGATGAIKATDHNAYGSLYQWGRYSDGHELITWTNSTTGASVNAAVEGTSSTSTVAPPNTSKMLSGGSSWYTGANRDALWQGEAGTNNPCPQGYRLPLNSELTTLVGMESISNTASAATSALAFTTSGYRFTGENGVLKYMDGGYYWSSSANGFSHADYRLFASGDIRTRHTSRGNAMSVRCIKN